MKNDDKETSLITDDKPWPGVVNQPPKENTNAPASEPSQEKVSLLRSYRKWIVIICTASMIFIFATHSSMSSALICMIPGDSKDGNESNLVTTPSNTNDSDWMFHWDKSSQGWVLSSFFIGYYLSQLPSGIAATKWGPKKVLVIGMILTVIFQGLTVPATQLGLAYVYADRTIAGFIVGFLYAPTFALVGQWTPKQELSLVLGLVGSGMELGNMVSFLISTFACGIDFQEGWPILFYSLSAIGLITTLAVAIFVSDSPFSNKYISNKEIRYIAGSVPKLENRENALQRIPVKSILKSMPVWAIIVAQAGSCWFYYFFTTVTPLYLKEVLKLSEFETNLLSGIPFIFILPAIYISGYISDKLVAQGITSNTRVRKINDFFCKIIPGGCLFGLAFLPKDSVALVFVLNTIAAIFLSFSYVSWMANPVDLGPAYTGFIVGLCEGASMWVAVVNPIFTETVTEDKTREQWQIVIFTTCGLLVVTHIFYVIFASGELQPWALSSYQYTYKDIDNQDGVSSTSIYPVYPGSTTRSISYDSCLFQVDGTSGSLLSSDTRIQKYFPASETRAGHDSLDYNSMNPARSRSKSAQGKLESGLTAEIEMRNSTHSHNDHNNSTSLNSSKTETKQTPVDAPCIVEVINNGNIIKICDPDERTHLLQK